VASGASFSTSTDGGNAGKLGFFGRAEMDPAFADAAFALRKAGDISEPVLSSFGWHVIKLEDRKPAVQRSFDEVRDLVFAEMRKRYVDEQREAAIAALRDDPKVKVNRDAVDALYVPVPTGKDGAGPTPPTAPAKAPPPTRAPGTPPPGLAPR